MIKAGSPRGLTIPLPEFKVLWSEFDNENPTDEHATENIIQKYMSLSVNCHYCKSDQVKRAWGQSVARCTNCLRESHLFAQTFFGRAECIRAYSAAVWLRERGVGISKNFFAKVAEVSQSTGWEIQTKLNHLIASSMSENAMHIGSSLLQAVFTKRSSQTEARKHPRSEQDGLDPDPATSNPYHGAGTARSQPDEESWNDADRTSDYSTQFDCAAQMEDGVPFENTVVDGTENQTSMQPDNPLNSCDGTESVDATSGCESESNSLENLPFDPASLWDEDMKVVFDTLSAKPKCIDSIITDTGLPMGRVQAATAVLHLILKAIVQVSPTHYAQAGRPAAPSIAKRVAEFEQYIISVHHGISRKNVQPYMAAIWCLLDRTMWSAGSLFSKCVSMSPKSRAELRDYVSPLVVKSLPA